MRFGRSALTGSVQLDRLLSIQSTSWRGPQSLGMVIGVVPRPLSGSGMAVVLGENMDSTVSKLV